MLNTNNLLMMQAYLTSGKLEYIPIKPNKLDLPDVFAIRIFSHPDYTVGFGLSPNQPYLTKTFSIIQ